jgi:glutamyl-tRNA(Gln) amidotransferase subunit E
MSEFQFKPFDEMTPEDYAEIGFKSGLEVHQQLLTERKLFCRCPAGMYNHQYHSEILRHMRPTLSELGEYDGTALMEFKTKKEIIYRINHESVCTYEMDDTPPFEMNPQALDIAIEIGHLMNATVVDEIHIARKQYLDGSIPTGFQRTAIVTVGGWLPYKDRKIGIIQMSIEEDSCREESDIGHRRVYIADRLGMPLVETVTEPHMITPQEVADVCQIIRKVCRSTGKVRTGIGAAREDVNVSVHGGTRIEIKGVPKIKEIPLLTYNEAMRQWNLLRLRDELHKRGIRANTLKSKIDDVTRFLRKTKYQPIYDAIKEGQVVKCVTLKDCKGIFRWQTQTDTFFSKEVSDRVRVIACLTNQPNLIHSDYPGETISSSDGQKVRKATGATEDDLLVLVWGDNQDTETAVKEIIIRVREATIGVPSETRQALRDGTNGFERILPGPDRMYPDTDLPPLRVSDERSDKLRDEAPVQYWINEKWYGELGVPADLISELSISTKSKLFEKAVKELKIDPVLASVALIQFPKRLKRMKLNTDSLTSEVLEKILIAMKDRKIVKEGVFPALEQTCVNGGFSDDVLLTPATDAELEEAARLAVKEINTTALYDEANKPGLIMANIMNMLRGRINGETVKKYLNENEIAEVK